MSEFFHQLPILSTVGLVLIFGFIGSRLARLIKLPSVTGYIFAGVIVGKSLLGWIGGEPEGSTALILENISVAALGLIAFSIGAELRFSKLKRMGKSVLPIALLAAVGATIVVAGIIILIAWLSPRCLFPELDMRSLIPLALILGAIASATAPAAILAVINEYRARGPLSDALIATVAIDDVFCIIIFGLIFPVSVALTGVGAELSFSGVILVPLREIIFSLVLGGAAGGIVTPALRKIKGKSSHMVIILSFVLLLCGLATRYHLSPLLTNMAFGCLIINLIPRGGSILSSLQSIEPPLFVAFFTIAGIHLDLKLLASVGVLGLIYFLTRVAGKIGGAHLGARLIKAPPAVRRYLGLGLLPQAGVAIGLVILVQENPHLGGVYIAGQSLPDIVTNCILAVVALNELIGPLAAKFALSKAGEINQKPG
ncbi:MAG: cation:proton antiporter [Candidatus Auribacterota bacterium]|nr:cation:proton antiporter [Candidatus Auribacterota bacterium]